MNQSDKAQNFAGMHNPGKPLIIYNAWDAGSAKAIVAAGAQAIATSSWAVAAAQGYADGEDFPFDFLERVAARIAATVDVPVSVDFEGGYSEEEDDRLAANLSRVIGSGAIGINFEDRIVKGRGLYGIDRQARRISALRRKAADLGVPLFINARTDLFLGQGGDPADSIGAALDRAKVYAGAGASGYFIPGLTDEALIAQICDNSPIPVNVMMMDGVPSIERLAAIGVARVSFGTMPYSGAMQFLGQQAREALSGA